MDVAVFSEAATPKSTLKKDNRSTRVDSSKRAPPVTNSVSRNKTARRQNSNEGNTPYLRRSTKKRSPTSSGKINNTKRTRHSDSYRPVVPTTAYQLPQVTDNEVDWANMSPPQSKFQLTRTPVKRITNEMDDGSKGEVSEERNNKLVSEVVTVNMKHVTNDQDVASSIDPVTDDDVVVDNEVTIVTVTDNGDDSSIKVASTQHSETNNSILIPSYKEDANILPASIQCNDNDLAYLERMANIKLLKELTHKSSQLDKELKNIKQDVEETLYKCQKTDEEYASLCITNKRTAIMVHHFLNNKHLDTIPEVSTEELQAAGDVTLDKKTTEQLQQAHKELKVQLQTITRSVEKKKAKLEKQKDQNKGTYEKTASLQAEKEQLTTKLKEMTEQEVKLREQITSLQQQQLNDKDYEKENRYFMKQLEILKERCELYKQRENNMKQISEYMVGLEQCTRIRHKNII